MLTLQFSSANESENIFVVNLNYAVINLYGGDSDWSDGSDGDGDGDDGDDGDDDDGDDAAAADDDDEKRIFFSLDTRTSSHSNLLPLLLDFISFSHLHHSTSH